MKGIDKNHTSPPLKIFANWLEMTMKQFLLN